MSQEWLKKYLKMKPEVNKIFDDLEAYHNYCRMNMLKFDERDLYKSEQYQKFERHNHWKSRNS